MEIFKDSTRHQTFKTSRIAFQYDNPNSSQEPSESVTEITTVSRTEGERNKSWKRKVNRGANATTNFIGHLQTISSSSGVHVFEYETTPTNHLYRELTGDILKSLGLPALQSSSTIDLAEQIAREKFYAEYRRQVTSFQGLTAVGELRETIRMLKSPAKALRKRIGQYYNGVLKSKARSMRSNRKRNSYLRSTWLEASFGWAPLIGNISDAANAVQDAKYRLNRELIQIKTSGNVTDEEYNPNAVAYSVGSMRGKYGSRTKQTTFVTYRGAIRIAEDSPYNAPAATWGFDPSQIIPTVWELIPYSFLIDYFTNIGKLIDSASLRRPDLAWGARTEGRIAILQSVDFRSENQYSNDLPLYKIYAESNSPSSWTAVNKIVSRTPIGTVSLPDLRFRLPRTSIQWLNIGALSQLKNRGFRYR